MVRDKGFSCCLSALSAKIWDSGFGSMFELALKPISELGPFFPIFPRLFGLQAASVIAQLGIRDIVRRSILVIPEALIEDPDSSG